MFKEIATEKVMGLCALCWYRYHYVELAVYHRYDTPISFIRNAEVVPGCCSVRLCESCFEETHSLGGHNTVEGFIPRSFTRA